MSAGELNTLEECMLRLKQEFMCPICRSLATNPKTLPCGHYLCSDCCTASLRRNFSNCPTCRSKYTKRSLREDTQIQGVTHAIEVLLEAYENMSGTLLSQIPTRRYTANPLPDLSQRFPYPVKPQSSITTAATSGELEIPEPEVDDDDLTDIGEDEDVIIVQASETEIHEESDIEGTEVFESTQVTSADPMEFENSQEAINREEIGITEGTTEGINDENQSQAPIHSIPSDLDLGDFGHLSQIMADTQVCCVR
ncbi:hypothetical protein BKA69DRAFT_1058774 [Paraphysoderma sedebokerense]|nr:hypothetical protein BKA69DRAFT_1058774 [Paraphysoderma sedebokerense]